MRKEHLLIVGVVLGSLLLMGGLAGFGSRPRQPIADVLTACVQHTGVGIHVHPRLTIILDGQPRPIPSDIGVTRACMRPLHTHDDSGTLHLEFPIAQEVILGQFFAVWGQPFSRTQILDRVVTADDALRVTVNGQEAVELENLVLHDRDEISVEVSKKVEGNGQQVPGRGQEAGGRGQ